MFKNWLHNIPFGLFAIICYVCTVIIGWSYGNNFPAYVAVTVVLAIFAYYRFFFVATPINQNIRIIIWLILFVSFLMSLSNGDIQSFVMVNVSLILPFSFCSLKINYSRFQKQLIIASVVNLLIIQLLLSNFQIWNSNSLAFMIFSGISVAMLWFKFSTKAYSKIASITYLGYATTLLLMTGCRNAGMVIIACFALLLLPNGFYKNRLVYRSLYLAPMLLTIVAAEFMKYVLSDAQLMDGVLSFTTSFSEKAWGMDTHYILLEKVAQRFQSFDFITQLFGMGIKTYHTHNLFYQCLLFYGYIGTFLVYIIYIYIFEVAYKLIRRLNDTITLSCFIILVGHFLLQIGEVYMLGAETANLMALLPAGVILQRWSQYKYNNISR